MKNIVIGLIVILFSTYCVAQDCEPCLFGEKYTMVDFRYDAGDDAYPIIFHMLTTQDTLMMDTSDFDSFVRSVYKGNSYMPVMGNAFHKAFDIVFKGVGEREIYNDCELFYTSFENDSYKIRKTGQIKLQTGEVITYGYCRITGVFMKFPKDEFWNVTVFSLGIQDKNLISTDTIVVPIAISNYDDYNQFELHIQNIGNTR